LLLLSYRPILPAIAKKPQPPKPAKTPEPSKPTIWSIYKIAAKGVWLDNVEAADEATAMEKGCVGIQGAGHEVDGATAVGGGEQLGNERPLLPWHLLCPLVSMFVESSAMTCGFDVRVC
jgi:hypothetical protein